MTHKAAQEFMAELPGVGQDLPYSPALLSVLFAQTGEDSCASVGGIAETIEKDQGLTAKVLAMANSAYYGLQAQVKSIPRAAAVLGITTIRSIVLSLGLKAMSRGRPLPEEFDLAEYWQHQYTVGLLARSMADDAGDPDPDAVFTAGLLHDLGKLIIALYRPDHWEAINALVDDEELTPCVAEDRHWGLDHAVVGALLLGAWDFPAALVEPVNWHHSPDLASEYQTRAALVGLADAVTRLVDGNEYDPQHAEHARIMQQGCELFGFDEDEVVERCEDILQDEEIEHFLEMTL